MRVQPRPARFAFTLVELLVVISITALLISLLMPALARVKKVARQTQCLAQHRQMTVAFTNYAMDHQGVIFPVIHKAGEYWFSKLEPHGGGSDEVLLCPETEPGDGGWGRVDQAWGPGGGWMHNKTGSYGMNLWLTPPRESGDAFFGDGNMDVAGYYRRVQRVENPSKVPVFGDSPWVGAWPDHNDFMPPDLTIGFGSHQKGYFMGRFCIARHFEGINVSFVDGGAGQYQVPDLWGLQWSKVFIPGDPP